MTIFGLDCSHFDGTLTLADLKRAAAEGIAFFTHKLGEGLGAEDATQSTALAAARDAGIRVLGGYWFLHGNLNPITEAQACIAMADKDEPWWRTFPGWVWQADAETSPTGLPSPAHVKAFADALSRQTQKTVLVYASHGQYGNTLNGLGHPLWNANYPSNAQKPFKDLYPGDSYAGWSSYSGQVPAIAQFASSATVAGKKTCDVNAFRGTIDELLTLIGVKPTVSEEDDMPTADEIAAAIWAYRSKEPGLLPMTPLEMVNWAAKSTPTDIDALVKVLVPAVVAALKAEPSK